MAFFDEEVETVWVTTSKLMEEGTYPNALKEAILYAIYNNESIPAHIIAANIGGFQSSVESAWKYAVLGDDTDGAEGYYYGLPEGTKYYGVTKDSEIKRLLEEGYGETVNVVSVNLNALTAEFYALFYCQVNYNWVFDVKGGGIVYATRPFNVFYITRTSVTNGILSIRTEAETDPGDGSGIVTEVFTIRIAFPSSKGPWYQVTYYLDSEPSYYIRVIVYDTSTGTVPSLDIDSSINKKEYYPVVPLRVDHKNVDKYSEELGGILTVAYDTSKKFLAKINISLDDVIEAISSPEDPDDLDDISDCYFIFGMDIYTEEQESIEYLYKYFKELHDRGGITKDEYITSTGWIVDYRLPPTQASVNVIISKELLYQTEIQYNFIEITTVTGSIGPIGTFTNVPWVYDDVIKSNGDLIDGDGNVNPDFENYTYIASYVLLSKQTSANSYTQIMVHGLLHTSVVLVSGMRCKSYLTYDSEVRKSGSFFIPIHHTILKSFSGTKENLILYASMKIAVYSIHIEKLDWWASSGFRVLINIVSVFVGGYNFGMALQAAVGALAGAAATAALMTFVGKLLITAFVLDYAVDWVLENIGGDLGLLLAVAVAVGGAYAMGGIGGVNSTFAGTLMKVVTTITKVVSTYNQIGMEALNEDYEDFTETYNEKMEAINEAMDMLEGYGPLDNPLMFVAEKPSFDSRQTPEQYYKQKLEQNPGVISLLYPSVYHKQALTLPELGYDNTLPAL